MEANKQLCRFSIEQIAALAKLRLTEAEGEMLYRDFSEMLAFADTVMANTSSTTDLPSGADGAVRDDTVQSPLPQEVLLRNAPAVHEGYLQLPPVLGEEGAL